MKFIKFLFIIIITVTVLIASATLMLHFQVQFPKFVPESLENLINNIYQLTLSNDKDLQQGDVILSDAIKYHEFKYLDEVGSLSISKDVTIQIPKEFELMDRSTYTEKYGVDNGGTVVTDSKTGIDIVFALDKTVKANNEINSMITIRDNIVSLLAYSLPSVEFDKSLILDAEGKLAPIISFTNTTDNNITYNNTMALVEHNDALLMISINSNYDEDIFNPLILMEEMLYTIEVPIG